MVIRLNAQNCAHVEPCSKELVLTGWNCFHPQLFRNYYNYYNYYHPQLFLNYFCGGKLTCHRYIFSLASNPFYLWLICTIFYEAGEGYVPTTLTQVLLLPCYCYQYLPWLLSFLPLTHRIHPALHMGHHRLLQPGLGSRVKKCHFSASLTKGVWPDLIKLSTFWPVFP